MSRRHNAKQAKLNLDFNERKALMRQQVSTLINFGHLETTLARAKYIKSIFDKTASKAKEGTLHSRRQLISSLSNPDAVAKLISALVPDFGDRTGGFTTITKLGPRRGDGAPMAKLELVKSTKPAEKENEPTK